MEKSTENFIFKLHPSDTFSRTPNLLLASEPNTPISPPASGGDAPKTIEKLSAEFSAFPFPFRGVFHCFSYDSFHVLISRQRRLSASFDTDDKNLSSSWTG